MNSKELKKLGFKEVGSFIVESGNVDAVLNASANDIGSGVYCWILIDNQKKTEEVVYVGKYKHTIKTRWGQHKQGFKKNSTGKKNAKYIHEQLTRKNEICWWGKQSNSEVITYMNILNEKVKNSFSVYGADEEDLIAYLTKHDGKPPSLNKTKGG